MAAGNLTRGEAAARAGLVGDVAYDVALDLTDPAADRFASDTTVRFACREPGATTFLELLDAVDVHVELNGEPLPGAYDPATGRIVLPSLAPRNEVRVRALCRYEHTGVGLHRFRDPVDGEVYLYTQFEPSDAQRVFACFDQPDIKATFTLRVAVPDHWQVASNGAATGEADGYRTFATTPLIPTYVAAVVAGPYHRVGAHHDGIDLGIWCRSSLAAHLDPDEILEVTAAGFDFFHRAFGHRYAFGKYDQCFVPEFNAGAMENAACVTFSEQHIFRSKVTDAERERRAETILHEMAHMWFGDLVTMRWWDDLWLNESFATYMAFHALAAATRFTGAWATFANGWKTWALRQDQLPTTHPIVADIPDTAATKVNFDGITYAKGAAVLRQLVAWVGEDAFFAGTARYFERHAFGNATLADFLAALEETSGRDLEAWSAQWLETAGVNTLRPRWRTVDTGDGPRFSGFTIEQSAPERWPTLRSHRVAVGLYEPDGERLVRTERVELDVTAARTPVPSLEGRAVPPLVLVNDGDLAYAKVRLDEGSLATLETRLGAVADPLARSLCWAAAWDMVRDAELPARRYLAIVLANVAGETELGVVQSLLRQAASAVELFADPAGRDELRRRLAGRTHELLHQAAPGSDLQLAYAGAFIDAAREERHLHALQRLLDGTLTVAGLTVDTELRWRIVIALAAAGVADEALIDAEEQRDPTDMGRRRAATARAARPDPAAKEEAWRLLCDPDLPFATMRAVMAGFNRPEQPALVAPYVERYFEALPAVWAGRVPEVALAFTEGLYPTPAASEELLARTEAFLAGTEVPAPFRRLLVEGADNVGRILRARACDAAASSGT